MSSIAKLKHNGLDYFPHYTTSGNKLNALFNKYGYFGTGLFFDLLGVIYNEGFYVDIKKLDLEFYFTIKDVDIGKAMEVIEFACKIRLFDLEMYKKGILTSSKIQKQYFQVIKQSRKKITIDAQYLIIDLSKEMTKKQIKDSVANYEEPKFMKSNLDNEEEVTEEEFKKLIGD